MEVGQELMGEKSIDKQLKDYGFLPLEKILTKSSQGDIFGRFIKVINHQGYIAYVDLDEVDGYVAIKPGDLTTIERKMGTVIPYSKKTGALETVGTEVMGIAIECRDGVCTLIRTDETMEPKEVDFTIIEHRPKRALIEDGSAMAYPIVRFKEIRENPDLISKIISMATNNLRNASYQAVTHEIKKLSSSCKCLKNECKNFINTINDAFCKLSSSIKKLEKMRCEYHLPLDCDDDRCKYKLIIYNLYRRHEMLKDLLTMGLSLCKYRQHIEDLTKKFSDWNEHLKCSYKYVNSIYDDPHM